MGACSEQALTIRQLCDCVNGEETIEHYLLHCCLYADARREMVDYIQDTGVVSHSKGNLTVPENVLLAPSSSNSISEKDNSIIKAAFFQYYSRHQEEFVEHNTYYCFLGHYATSP